MKPSFGSLLLLLLFGTVLVVVSAAEHRADLDDLADQLGKGITEANLRSAAVADFQTPDGKSSDLGWYLANQLSDTWLRHDQKFRLLDRAELKDAKLSADDLRSPEMLRRIGSVWGVDSIVTGTVDASSDHYLLAASIRRVADGTIVAAASQPIPHSRVLDLLSPQGLDIGGPAPLPAGVNEIGVPICTKCPIPPYPDKARKARLQSSTVVLSVVVSAEGHAARIAILKDPGFGLTDRAIETVSVWEFKPAMGKDRKPVAVKVPVEVTFRITRN